MVFDSRQAKPLPDAPAADSRAMKSSPGHRGKASVSSQTLGAGFLSNDTEARLYS